MKATTLLVAVAAVSTYSVQAQAICKQRMCTTDTNLACDRASMKCPPCMGLDSSGITICKPTNIIGSCSVAGLGGFTRCGAYSPSSSSGSGSGSGGTTPKPSATTVAPTTLAPTTLSPTTLAPTTLASPTTAPTSTTKKPATKTPTVTPSATTASSSSSSDGASTPVPTQTASNSKGNTTSESETPWALYAGIGGGALVLVGIVMIVVMRMNGRDDDDDDEPYKPTAPTTSQTYASQPPPASYNGGSATAVAANIRAQIDGPNQPQTAYGNSANAFGGPAPQTTYAPQESYGHYGHQDAYAQPQSSYAQPAAYNNSYAQDHSAVNVAPAAKSRSDVHHSDVWGNVPSSYQEGTPAGKTKGSEKPGRENETRLSVEF